MEERKWKILVVDDSLTIRMQIRDLLMENGFEVLLAENGTACLETAEADPPDFILLDIIMPDMDGIEITGKLKSDPRFEDTPILILTTEADVENKVRGLNAGADDYITKPFEIEELLARINVAARNKALQDELRSANQKILEQQKAVIEEERMKVLLQIAGSTAHELNQPLMGLLGNIELMTMNKHNQEKLFRHIDRIEVAGKRISEIVKKIQSMRLGEMKSYMKEPSAIDFAKDVFILMVEGSDEDYRTIHDILKDHVQINLVREKKISNALQLLEKGKFDLIFSDYLLPDGNSIEFMRTLEKMGVEIPVVIITGQGDEMIASQIIKAGAYDYLPKSRLNDKALMRAIANSLEKVSLKREVREAQKKIAEMSIRDELTGLYNRRYFMEALDREVHRAERYDADLALCMLDLDHFKSVNDTYGHPAGDAVLARVGKKLRDCFRQSDLICRYGGEEFVVILPSARFDDARSTCERFRDEVSKHRFAFENATFNITVSIGFAALKHVSPKTPDHLLSVVDGMLYEAKNSGRNRVIGYAPARAGADGGPAAGPDPLPSLHSGG